ncbi:hypothetical protein TVAG_185070 [Trichomonas vaginalis G3]|uniref:Tetraspanin family protein n=1 Tax=Trichomonas vaginalis (strain ATCC PRA-98 / G3) TaxID=412133 RepID=A2D8F2_TRIV3|nr:tetraspanin family [Trichomonas vaginalis G3]EAY23201.1 hypothetical protein TVAG_185070 [Trichomonas vaginalis G3]KAI5534150.1 tetraspanin family [Trichomonas vaginalis G3]|eukprot:XP_001584187.1 hypothetical protein [Trichomonas vaginalis G3]
MANCCSKLVLFIITLITIGAITAATISATVLIYKYKIPQISGDKTLAAILIVADVIFIFAFVFDVVASFSKNKCMSVIQSIIFLVLAAICIGIIVGTVLYNKKAFDKFGAYWENCSKSTNDSSSVCEAIREAEKTLGCTGWPKEEENATNETNSSTKTCKDTIQGGFKKYMIFVYVAFGIFAAILIVGTVLSCIKLCQSGDETNGAKEQAEQPLSYGW